MVEKEVEDYIQTQKSLGVSDHAIHKSLVNAGYEEHEFKDTLEKHSRAHEKARQESRRVSSPKKNFLTPAHIIYLNIIIVVAIAGLFVYFTDDYNTKIAELSSAQTSQFNQLNNRIDEQEASITAKMDSVKAEVEQDIQDTKTRIDTVNVNLDKKIKDANYQSLTRDTALSNSIQESTSQSLSELEQFSTQLEEFRQASVDFSPVIPKAIESVVTIGEKGSGFFTTAGSGVFINNLGYIVTNWHVVDDLDRINIKTDDGTDYTARLVGRDEEWDVAVLKLEVARDDFPFLPWADSDEVSVGQHVIAVGNPVGFDSTVTEGIISNTRRLVNGADGIYYLQTDVAINSGNSGGPLIDKEGRIVGIATLKYSKTGFEGLSFALRSNDVKGIVLRLLEDK